MKPTESLFINDFPAGVAQHVQLGGTPFIFQVLADILSKALQDKDSQVWLPALSTLADYFRCSQMNVYDSLQELRYAGYDYELSGFEVPILFWRNNDEQCPVQIAHAHHLPPQAQLEQENLESISPHFPDSGLKQGFA